MIIVSLVFIIGFCMILFEKRQPGRSWPKVWNWWLRSSILNGLQIATVYLAGVSWDRWMQTRHHGTFQNLNSFWGGILGYLVITFVFYWWHRWRHASNFLWRWFHQLHHSPQRLEIVTAFYKHPFELIADSVICSAILYIGLGLTPAAAANAVLLSGLAELFYHWNIKTPHWLGYIFQRPESHCIHHQDGVHAYNYSDLPLWDMLFGTFKNPQTWDDKCGLGQHEHRFVEMLCGQDVYKKSPKKQLYLSYHSVIAIILLLIGITQIIGDITHQKGLKAIAAAWGASPAPKVFTSVDGLEVFSSQFFLSWTDQQGIQHRLQLTPQSAKKLRGPYNRRNVYGAVLSGGPVISSNEAFSGAYEAIMTYALNSKGSLLKELGIDPENVGDTITIEVIPSVDNNYQHLNLVKELRVK